MGPAEFSPAPWAPADDWFLKSNAGGATVGGIGEKMEPMTMAMITAGSNVLGKVLTPTSGGPSRADSGGYNIFDNSGFAVSFAGDVGSNSPDARGGDATASATGGMNPWLIGAAIFGGVVVLVAWTKKKSH